MTLADSLVHLFGVVTNWNEHAHGFGLFLLVPVALLALADRRIRGAR